MRTFSALFAIVLLLLPSSLGAVVMAQESCAKMATMAAMLCCCEHQAETPGDLGESISRKCCCDFDLPVAPSPLREGVRMQSEEKSDSRLLPCPLEAVSFSLDRSLPFSERATLSPPRAPPQPLYLSFQSFLI